MKVCLDYEDLYIKYFKKLLDLKQNNRNNIDSFGIDHERLFEDLPNILICGETKKGKQNISHTNTRQLVVPNYVLSKCERKHLDENKQCYLKFNGEKSERKLSREGLLTKLELCNGKDEHFDLLIEELIDMEERFVEEYECSVEL